MKNRREVKALLDYFAKAKEELPKMSAIGTDNHNEIDELIQLFNYYLHIGDIPDMSNYLEETSYAYALWILSKYSIMDDIIKDVLEEGDE